MSYDITARGLDADGQKHFFAMNREGKVLHYENGYMVPVGQIDVSQGAHIVRAEFTKLTGFEPNGAFVGQTQELKKDKVTTNAAKPAEGKGVDKNPTAFNELMANGATKREFEHEGVTYSMTTASNGKKQFRAAGKMVGQAVFAEALNAHEAAPKTDATAKDETAFPDGRPAVA